MCAPTLRFAIDFSVSFFDCVLYVLGRQIYFWFSLLSYVDFSFPDSWVAFDSVSGLLLLFSVFGLINPVLGECDGSQMPTP